MVEGTESAPHKVVYFAVGPKSHQIVCPMCHASGKTVTKIRFFKCCDRQHYCSSCGEYLGTFKRPQL